MKKSEEDIKIKIVLPFLKSLGFEENELTLEESFHLRLGSHTVRVDTGRQMEAARPRLDILVKRNGQNYFVIEVKVDSHKLTDEDKEQAISYARLVHPIAPLAIVTNGRQSKIYDVLTKEGISEDEVSKRDYKIHTNDIDSIYKEAFEYFIGYSKENVRLFCDAQINEGMKTLVGSKEKPDRKFIPELYVPSKKLYKAFDEFLNSDKSVFAMVGESGIGKTCSMCGLTRDIAKDYPVLFYKAQELRGDLIKAISDDFNWQFSAYHDSIPMLKRLNNLFKDKKIIIFADGIDEWANADKAVILGDLASKIKNRNFKLVISCKSGQWDKFLSKLGTPTQLSEEIFSPSMPFKGFIVEPFDGEEFHNLIKKYREFYGFNGLFESAVLDECKRLPFLLRVFFEVANRTRCEHLTFSTKEFYDEYYRAVLQKMPDDKDTIENVIKSIAKALYEKNVDSIDIVGLQEALGLRVHEQIPQSLFECNILERTETESDSLIGFYFKKFRDYVIVFKINKWNSISLDEFEKSFGSLSFRDVQLDAINLFYRLADSEKKKVIDGPLREKAEAYLDLYTEVLDEHFYNLKHRFSPQTKDRIGFIGDLDIQRQIVRAYGFKPIGEKEEKIIFLPMDVSFWSKDTNLAYIFGATDMHACDSSDGFRNIDIKNEVLKNEITSQLKKIIKEGLLNEANNYNLSLEKALGIVVKTQRDAHGITDSFTPSKYLPITLDKIEYGVRRKYAYRYFQDQLIDKRINEGTIKQYWSGSTCSYNCSFSNEDMDFLRKQANNLASSKSEFEAKVAPRHIERIDEALYEALSVIRKRKDVIDDSILPDQDAWPSGPAYTSDFFKPDTLISILKKLYTLFFDEYKTVIETNFPTLKNHFQLYSQMPVHYFIVPLFSERPWIKYYECKNTYSDENSITICDDNDIIFDIDAFSMTYKNEQYKVMLQGGCSLISLMSPHKNYINVDIPSEFTVLRSMVYKQIEAELPNAIEKLFLAYGVTVSRDEVERLLI